MTAKKEMLIKQLAGLAVRYSATDWLSAAERLEEIARVARTLADTPKIPVAKKRLRRVTPTKKQIVPADELNLSPITEEFARYLMRNVGSRGGPNLRDLANYLGMKSDLPKSASAIVGAMCQHLDDMSETDRLNKIERAILFIEQRSPTGTNHYDRWVSLITRK